MVPNSYQGTAAFKGSM